MSQFGACLKSPQGAFFQPVGVHGCVGGGEECSPGPDIQLFPPPSLTFPQISSQRARTHLSGSETTVLCCQNYCSRVKADIRVVELIAQEWHRPRSLSATEYEGSYSHRGTDALNLSTCRTYARPLCLSCRKWTSNDCQLRPPPAGTRVRCRVQTCYTSFGVDMWMKQRYIHVETLFSS